VGFHPDEWRMVDHSGGLGSGAKKWDLVDVDIHRQVHFAVGPFDVGGDELGLEIHQLFVEGDAAVEHISGVQVSQIALRIEVAAFPESQAIGADQRDVDPNLWLGTERTAGHIVAVVEIGDAVIELQRLARTRVFEEEGTVDFGIQLENLATIFVFPSQAAKVLIEHFAGVHAVVPIGPWAGKHRGDLAAGDGVLELLRSPAAAPVEHLPVVEAPLQGSFILREDAGVGDGVTGAVKNMIGVSAIGIDRFVVDHGAGRNFVARVASGNFAHVAVLA